MKTKIKAKPVVIDLFAGVGGLSLGAERAGFKVICAVDIDTITLETHAKNFPLTNHLLMNILNINGNMLLDLNGLKKGELDGLIGGPPCQGFSTIGRRRPDDHRNELFISFFRLVNELKPRFFLAENVLGIFDQRFEEIRKKAFSFVKNDYILLDPLIVAAHECGAPTVRKRVFFIGYDYKHYSNALHLECFNKSIVPDNERIRVKRALAGLPVEINPNRNSEFTRLEFNLFENAQNGSFEELISGKIPEGVGSPEAIDLYYNEQMVSGCQPTRHSPEIIERYKNLACGQKDPISRAVKLNPGGFCPTLRAGTGPDKGSYQAVRPIHFSSPRVITPREAARLQGFPDWFVFHNTKWHSFRQIGNSVSPIVAEKLLNVIYQNMI